MPLIHSPQPDHVELLSPAGDWDCARAAIENGADAIYFGLDCGFNARHRAQNFRVDDLPQIGKLLRNRGVRGYVTMNTLVFPDEMEALVQVIERVASAGIDAVLVQDFGVARLVHTTCPDLEIHASTQMSLTSAETIQVAEGLGLARVVLARELSVDEIRKIAANTDVPLEVFIHGALCVAYSGQCLTSESLGGRSANRGQCAQACRLPYELICDGEDRDLDDIRYLLSPQDLAGYAAIPDLVKSGVRSLKIEGRLKTAEYVANITSHYRRAIDQAIATQVVQVSREAKREMELSFSRGFSPGWLDGNDHKRLVPGIQSAKRGIELGIVRKIAGPRLQLRVAAPVALGDGLAIHSQDREQEDQGGRVYSLEDSAGRKCKEIAEGEMAWIGFGRSEIRWADVNGGDVIFKNDDPKLNRRLRHTFTRKDPVRRRAVDFCVVAATEQRLQVTAKLQEGQEVQVIGTQALAKAVKHPIDASVLREKLGRLGGTQFEMRGLEASISGEPMVPMAILNQMRRDLVTKLEQLLASPPPRKINAASAQELLKPIREESSDEATPRLAVLCRTLSQLETACQSSVDMVYADFQDVRKYGEAVAIARGLGIPIGLATVRMQKPGETGLLRVLGRHRPDMILARNLAAIDHFTTEAIPTIADFSLNVSNHRSAEWLRSLGVSRVTPSYDLNRNQVLGLVKSVPASWLEAVIHQHMPMFHMEHCVFCAVLSPGTNKTNCGRPCDHHVVQLRDRVGAEHTLQADVACRNTLYNATPQSGAELVGNLMAQGVRWFRVELLEEKVDTVKRTIGMYQELLGGQITGHQVWQELKATNRVGVTRGTLEPKRNPLAIL